MTTTARLGLPLIEPGQAQKELTHNEALLLADAAVQASVVTAGANAPPSAPSPGACWIVGPEPRGAWAGRAHALAAWTAGGWRFVAAREGMGAWAEDARAALRFAGGQWRRGGAVADPAGGGTVDAEARSAVAAILAALRAHGLVAP